MKKFLIVALVAAGFFAKPAIAQVVFFDQFNTIEPYWGVDRRAPTTFESIPDPLGVPGNNVLRITTAPAQFDSVTPFYNTQGEKVAINQIGSWKASAGIEVSNNLIIDSLKFAYEYRTDMWVRTGLLGNETGANYPIIGLSKKAGGFLTWEVWDPDAPIDPNGASPGFRTVAAPVLLGLNLLDIVGTVAGYQFYINGAPVYTDSTVDNPLMITDLMFQKKNFNIENDNPAVWDNAKVEMLPLTGPPGAVPEPSTYGLAGAFLLLCAVAARKRFRNK